MCFLLDVTSIVDVVSLDIYQCMFSVQFFSRTVMKSGPEIVKAGLRQFFESAADDIEKMVENLKLGKVSSRNQVSERNWFTLSLQICIHYLLCLWIPVG